jgi:hypothetical protein
MSLAGHLQGLFTGVVTVYTKCVKKKVQHYSEVKPPISATIHKVRPRHNLFLWPEFI